MAFRKLSVMPPNSDDAVDVEKIELLKRAKEVLTSTDLKQAYDTKRGNKMRCSLSARSGRKDGCNTASFNEYINSNSNTSQGRLSDSDQSSYYTSTESGGNCSEKYPIAESESEWTSSMRLYREGYFIDHISRDVEPEAPTKEPKKTEKNESNSKSALILNDINDSICEEPQRNSNLNEIKPSGSLNKRNLSSSPCFAEKASYAEEASELKSAQKSPRRRRKKKKKKKKGSIIKRFFQRLK